MPRKISLKGGNKNKNKSKKSVKSSKNNTTSPMKKKDFDLPVPREATCLALKNKNGKRGKTVTIKNYKLVPMGKNNMYRIQGVHKEGGKNYTVTRIVGKLL